MSRAITVWMNASLAVCDDGMTRLENAALVTRDDRIEWIGAVQDLPDALRGEAQTIHDLAGAWVTPGLVDCHTHLVFAGNRATEYAERLRGVSYEAIARRGGGILTTVRATRAASEQQLFDESAPRLESLLAEGVTTLEVKSGYGLTLESEAKMLRVARALARHYPVRIRTTMLAAHVVAPEFVGRADEYIDTIARRWLPALHDDGLVDAVDVFCDSIGFDVAQARRLLEAAGARGIPVKMHAEQLCNLGGTLLATRLRALSCDHLEHAGAPEAEALAESGTVAVLLPIAYYCLGQGRKPPVPELRAARARIAIASDCNPGSAPGASVLLAMNMATRLFGLTADEALAGVTRQAARALGETGLGTLAPGAAADFVVWGIGDPDELPYWVGLNRCRAVVQAGRLARQARP